MIDDVAHSIHTACLDARVSAPLIVARLVGRAIVIDDALGIVADGLAVHDPALAVDVTRGRIARIDRKS